MSERNLRLEYIEAGTLTANPANWRKHPPAQLDALKSVLDFNECGRQWRR